MRRCGPQHGRADREILRQRCNPPIAVSVTESSRSGAWMDAHMDGIATLIAYRV
jgi:hypothetical protein